VLRLNPYVVILSMFIVIGVFTTIWGWLIIAKVKKIRQWPGTEGEIAKSAPGLKINDLLPEIVFNYTVDGRRYTKSQEFPSDLTPDKEFTDTYLNKYPVGAKVRVFYDPHDPEQATLEPGFISGDWMVFALGVGMTLFGVLSLFFSG
jgi:hypothetical protein